MGSLSQTHFSKAYDWNTPVKAPSKSCLHQLVERTAKRYPRRQAVHSHDRDFTYQELNASADKLAAVLREQHGVGPESFVPLCVEKSSFMILAILAILKAGGAYVPLDPAHPQSRLEYIIEQSGSSVMLVSAAQKERFSKLSNVTKVLVSSRYVTDYFANVEAISSGPDNVAYVIYTSGSTGKPKGVMVEHGPASLSVIEHGKRFGHDTPQGVRTLQFCSYTFDVSVVDFFSTLSYGGCLCIPSEEDRLADLEGAITRMNANLTILTPTVAQMLDPAKVPSLDVLCMTGETLNATLVRRWTSRQPPLRMLVNGYGPTEASVDCAAAHVGPKTSPANIGHCMGGQVWIVDNEDHNKLLPIGQVGELVISGPILARGYLHNEEKTKAAFIDYVPWLQNYPSQRIYKTGDIAKFEADGTIEYMGRRDNRQIKLHGIRIEVGEVEAAFSACEGINAQNIAVAKANLSGTDTLVGFFHATDKSLSKIKDTMFLEPTGQLQVAMQSAEQQLKDTLPMAMVPKILIPVGDWPRSVSGKTDRKLLTSSLEELPSSIVMQFQRALNTTSNEEEAGNSKESTQAMVKELTTQVLQKSDLELELQDDFFQIGGDSISVVKFIYQLRMKKISLTVPDIYEARTLGRIATLIDRKMDSGEEKDLEPFSLVAKDEKSIEQIKERVAELCDLSKDKVVDVYQCSPFQDGFMARSASYKYRLLYNLPEDFDGKKLRRALDKVIEAHEIIRTRIVKDEELGAVQVVVRDSRPLWMDDVDDATDFNYGTVLYQFGLATQEGKTYFCMDTHHAVHDGWSLSLIIDDIRRGYLDSNYYPDHTRFNHYIKYILDDAHQAKAKDFWKNFMGDVEGTKFPKHSEQPGHLFSCSAAYTHTISGTAGKTAAGGMTAATTLKAAWCMILSKLTGTNDVSYFTGLSGRNMGVSGIERMAGPTLSTLPIRFKIEPGWTVKQLQESIQKTLIDMIPYQYVGIAGAARLAGRKAGGMQNFFLVQPNEDSIADDKNDILKPFKTEKDLGKNSSRPFPLTTECFMQADGSVRILTAYDPKVLNEDQMKHLFAEFEKVLLKMWDDDEALVEGFEVAPF